MDKTTIREDGMIRLPAGILSKIPPNREYAIFTSENAIVLKSAETVEADNLLRMSGDTEDAPTDEIAREIHKQRGKDGD